MRPLVALIVGLAAVASARAQPTGWASFEAPTLQFLADGDRYLSYNVEGGFGAPGVLVSDDGGASWSVVRDGLPTSGDLKPVYLDGRTAFATEFDVGRLFRSDDGGATWSDATQGLTSPRSDDNGTGRYLADLVWVDGASGGYYLALSSFDAFRLGPSGWTRSSEGLPPYTEGVVQFFAFDAAVSGQTVVIASTFGIYRSGDGGRTWAEANQGFRAGGLPLGARAVYALDGRFYALASYPDDFGGVYRSDDDGQTWTRRSEGLVMQGAVGGAAKGVRSVNAIVSTRDALYLATSGGAGLYRSTDGEQWTPFNQGVPDGATGEPSVRALWTASPNGPVYALADTRDLQVTLRADSPLTPTEGRPVHRPLGLRLTSPNPSRGGPAEVEVSLKTSRSVRLTVVDALGRRLSSVHTAPGVGVHRLALDLPSLPPGVYSVHAVSSGSNQRESVRFTVSR